MKPSLLRPKSGQSKPCVLLREARRLLAPNKQGATPNGVILASIHRAVLILPADFVINRSFNPLNDTLSAALAGKMNFRSDNVISVNRP